MSARRTNKAVREERMVLLAVTLVAAVIWAPILALVAGA